MSVVTRFAGRDPGPAARVSGFIAHLRANNLRLGVAEADLALRALTAVEAADPQEARRALKAVCTGCRDEAARFDALFDGYWMDGGRVRQKVVPKRQERQSNDIRSSRDAEGEAAGGAGQARTPDTGEGTAESDGEGKLVATETRNLMRQDLRALVRPEEIAEAEEVAQRLGEALRDRRSRRRIASRKGQSIHFR